MSRRVRRPETGTTGTDAVAGEATLEGIVSGCLERLAQAPLERHDPFHIMGLATLGLDGRPRARSVVIRAFDPTGPEIAFNSDARSPKVAEMERDPRVSLLFYDREEGIQIRAEAEAQIHKQDERANAAWQAGSLFARRCYLQEPGPSSRASGPTSGLPAEVEGREPSEEELLPARRNFVYVTCRVEWLDWLSLHHDGHRRARFDFDAKGVPSGTWLVP